MAQSNNTGALPKTPLNSPARSANASNRKNNGDSGLLSSLNNSEILATKPKKRWNKNKKKEVSKVDENIQEHESVGEQSMQLGVLNANNSMVASNLQPNYNLHTDLRPERHESHQGKGHRHNVVPNVNVRALILPRVAPFCGAALVLDENFIKEAVKWQGKEQINIEYDCGICNYHCDNLTVVEKHINDARHLENLKVRLEEITMESLPKPSPGHLATLTKLVQDVFVSHGMFAKDQSLRREIAEHVHSRIHAEFPSCTVRLYGSTATGMGLNTSNINLDLVVNSSEILSKVVLAVTDFLSKDEHFESVECNLSSEVPGITFVDRETKFNCRMCLNNHRSYETSKLLECYESIDLRVRYLAVMFRVWASMCDIDQVDLGAWPPYAFSLLLVYFLQQIEPPVLPVLHDLVESSGEKGPECYLDPEDLSGKWTCSNEMSLGELWLSLLRFYALDFAANELIVCIQQAAPLKRSVKKWGGRKTAIEDPFISKRNVSRTIVNMMTFDYIVMCLRKTYLYFAIPQTSSGPIFGSIRKALFSEKYGPDYANFMREKLREIKKIMEFDECFASLSATDTRRSTQYPPIEVSPEVAYMMFQKFHSSHFLYTMNRNNFTGGKVIPQVCPLCERSGHLKAMCPEEKLPDVHPLPPMTLLLKNYLTRLCMHTFQIRSPTQNELEERQAIVEHIEEFLVVDFPEAKLELFGSSCNGFGLVKSDLDICLTFKNNLTGEKLNFANIIDQIHLKLRKFKALNSLVAITTAKVPILKFVHSQSKLEGDISVYNTLAQRNTKMLRTYAEIDTRVKMLGFMVKEFAKLCDICDASRGSLSSYAYILMVIYFLQRCDPPIVPVLQELHEPGEQCEPVLVEGCNTYFMEDLENVRKLWSGWGQNTTPVGVLWLQFLRFYTEQFDYSVNVIAIRQIANLPRYDKLWNSKSMAIEDPFDLSHNLGIALSKNMHIFILKAFLKARTRFGTHVNLGGMEASPNALRSYFFDKLAMVDSNPPNDRGCRACKKIGHQIKDCPTKKAHADWKTRKAKMSESVDREDASPHGEGMHRRDRDREMERYPRQAAPGLAVPSFVPPFHGPIAPHVAQVRPMAPSNRGPMNRHGMNYGGPQHPPGIPRGLWMENGPYQNMPYQNGQQQRYQQRYQQHQHVDHTRQVHEMVPRPGETVNRLVGFGTKYYVAKGTQF